MKKTRQEYLHDLEIVQNKVATMGDMAVTAVKRAVQALTTGDKDLAGVVMAADDAIDDLIVEIEDNCILLIAKQQPIAHDLRIIATGFKISTDIERIGDHAFDIAKTTQLLEGGLSEAGIKNTVELANCAISMVEKSIEAYRKCDVKLASEVCKMDKEMDEVFAKAFYALADYVAGEGHNKNAELLFIARFLERIGDHAVNIAEWVIYLETAERVKHNKKVG